MTYKELFENISNIETDKYGKCIVNGIPIHIYNHKHQFNILNNDDYAITAFTISSDEDIVNIYRNSYSMGCIDYSSPITKNSNDEVDPLLNRIFNS